MIAAGPGEAGRRPGRVDARVGDAEASAEIELGQLDAGLRRELGVQPEGPPGRDLEPLGLEDLRSDVGVDADQVELGCAWQACSAASA